MVKPKMQRNLTHVAEAQHEHENAAQDKFDEIKEIALGTPPDVTRYQIAAPSPLKQPQQAEPTTPKYQTFEKVTALMTEEQKRGLDDVAKRVMKHRSAATKGNADKERITANTLLRALIDNFLAHEKELQTEILLSENDARAWISKLFNSEVRDS